MKIILYLYIKNVKITIDDILFSILITMIYFLWLIVNKVDIV